MNRALRGRVSCQEKRQGIGYMEKDDEGVGLRTLAT